MSAGALRRRIQAGGRWQVVVPGVYATFTGPLGRRHRLRAALLHAGDGALLCGATATEVYALHYAPPPDGAVHVLVDHHCKVGSTGFVRIERTTNLPDEWSAGALPLVPVAHAVVNAVRKVRSLRDVRAALCEPVQLGLASPRELAEALAAGHIAGTKLSRRALSDIVAGCRSAPECELRDLVLRSKYLPEPRWNEPLPDPRGSRMIPDACWAEARLVIEIDSVEWHRLGDAPEATERRRARYAALGWRVLPVSPRRLREEPAVVLAEIESAYREGIRAR